MLRYQTMTLWLHRQRNASWHVIILSFCSAILIILIVTNKTTTNIAWAEPEWMSTSSSSCRSTLFQPFRVGCPPTCARAIGKNETMYRMNMEWNFGQPILFEPSQLPNAYEYGFNYQCPRIFVENFVHASQDLERQVKTEIPDINIKQQERLHLSLAYFCCLRRNETDWVREITQEWIHHHHPFDFTVKFNKLECWHERHNSVTNIIVGDDATQSVLMKMLHDLYDTIHRRAGIKMEIPRENQMPFHVTLSGIFYGTKEEGDDIRPQIPVIHKLVSKISQRFGDRWAGYHGMRITHDPKVRSQGTWHAGNQPTN